ncbi:prepilin peptidase [Candidatus Saccharibacteria bacterium]|nr:MAG: prepilin peptidase [Candidatus Saccharibacteria bacterium]PID98890.1 MAG: prepilin peptidase [Candidatus Saccharibacteria bacterium]
MLLVILFLYGVIFGSFINALVWRLYKQAESTGVKSKSQAAKKATSQAKSKHLVRGEKHKVLRKTRGSAVNYSIFKGRSVCPSCEHQLAAKDLVPVLSWLLLRGKCQYCRKPISAQYPLVELLTGVLFALCYLSWQFPLDGLHLVWFCYSLGYIVFFVALAVYDAKWFLLPNKLVFPLVGVAASEVLVSGVWQHSWAAVWQPLLGAGLLYGLFWGLFQVSRGTWIGGGDVKLALALGLIAGSPLYAMLVLFIASLLGTLVSVPQLITARKGLRQHIPFGPYLLAACFIVMLYGENIVSWYTELFL